MDIKRLLRKELPAPLWKRVVAYLIDVLVLAFILSPLKPFEASYSSFSDFYTHFTSATFFTFQFIVAFLFIVFLSLAYWTVLEYRFHQTLGKYFMRLIVRSENKLLTFHQCLVRNLAKLSSLLLFLDTLYMLFTHTSQRYSETLAHTEVITHG